MSIVALLTDFGVRDTYVAEVKGVLLGTRGTLQLVDLTHDVPAYDIEAGAFHLWRSYRHFPKRTWFLAVVDPGVGSDRRPLYVKTKHYHFVGPDNGVLTWAVRACEENQENAKYYQIQTAHNMLPTFHARDLFAPFIRSRLESKHIKLQSVLTITGSSFPVESRERKRRMGEILLIDHYGNAITSLKATDAAKIRNASVKNRSLRVVLNYASIEPNKTALVAGSHGLWEIAAKEGSAAEQLRLKKGDRVTLFLL